MKASIDIKYLSKLSHLSVSIDEAAIITSHLSSTIKTIKVLNKLNTVSVKGTPQVTNLANITRNDEIDLNRCFSQLSALSNAPRQYRGYFVVNSIM